MSNGRCRRYEASPDELVVAVDGSSTDHTQDICSYYADRLFRLDPFGDVVELTFAWLIAQCQGEWVFRIDDDEMPSRQLVLALPDLLANREVTHYWFRRRWLAEPEGRGWFADNRWWPDWQLRLFRNIRSIVQTPDQVHRTYRVAGAGRYVPCGAIYHFDHLVHSAADRARKCLRYERELPGHPYWEVYLPPANAALSVRPIPQEDPPWPGSTTRSSNTRAAQGVSVPELERARGLYALGPELFQATLTGIDAPDVMLAGQPCLHTLQVRNDGAYSWSGEGAGPWVRVSYHWLRAGGEVVVADGLRADISCPLQPGDAATVPAWVLPPLEEGDYQLQWDLVVEYVSWFSERGWPTPTLGITVVRATNPLDARRAAWLVAGLGVPAAMLDSPDTRQKDERHTTSSRSKAPRSAQEAGDR
jgi:hypothetical protein